MMNLLLFVVLVTMPLLLGGCGENGAHGVKHVTEVEVLSYIDVKNSIDKIRKIHPKALERSDDIRVLNQYFEYINKL